MISPTNLPSDEKALELLAARVHLPVLSMDQLLQAKPVFGCVSLSRCQQLQCIVLETKGELIGVVANPYAPLTFSILESHAKGNITFFLALQTDILACLSRHEVSLKTIGQVVDTLSSRETHDEQNKQSISLASVNDSHSPAVKLLNSTLYDALKAGASDIHLESTVTGLAVKYRIDGVLNSEAAIQGMALAEQTISRLKVLSELDISERRVPQDGSFRVDSDGRDIDLRVSIMPSVHGEDAVIRILDKRALIERHGSLTLEALGFHDQSLRQVRQLANQPYGMLLVTGPTGSGKTTTLYACLSEVNDGREKIITIEDPVEYQLAGVLQIPVNDKKGLNFARGLRSILRHDPDKIMVGEIRDAETAEIAVQSALTGHLVLTTVHANSVFDVFGRFTHMGLDPYAFASALNGVLAQRLVRLICPSCSTVYEPTDEESKLLSHLTSQINETESPTVHRLTRGSGCRECRGTGYKGRKAVAEVLAMDDNLREMIADKRPIRLLKEYSKKQGGVSLSGETLQMVLSGKTTLEEYKRVTLSMSAH